VSLTWLLYWFPIFLGAALGARSATRRHGAILGGLCAALWVAVVQANAAGAWWGDVGTLLSVLCGAAAIALVGYGASARTSPRGESSTARALDTPRQGEPEARGASRGGGKERRGGFGGLFSSAPAAGGDTGPSDDGDERSFALESMSSAFRQFDAWLEVHRYNDDPWADFDEFLRGTLFHWVGGTHVRPYRVLSEGDQLIPLREIEPDDTTSMVSARRGIEGYVATSGRSFVACDPTHGKLVEQLRAQSSAGDAEEVQSSKFKVQSQDSEVGTGNSKVSGEGPAWCFAIVRGAHKVGVVTVGHFAAPGPGDERSHGMTTGACPWSHAQLRLVELVIAQFWNMLTEVCRSRAAVTTDPGSSGLTRRAFFEIGREILADAYRQGEPVAVAVIGMEGLRALDDEGHWETTDEVRAAVSNVLKQRLRADDRLGRFDDSRFMLLLRRVDTGLATLIVKELMDRLAGVPAARKPYGERVEFRCGLAGSGVIGETPAETKPSLERLVAAALEACREAREAAVLISSDLGQVIGT
jgi:GGDEF domain-containing protein